MTLLPTNQSPRFQSRARPIFAEHAVREIVAGVNFDAATSSLACHGHVPESVIGVDAWALAYSVASATGCSYPGEVAGVALRRVHHASQMSTLDMLILVQHTAGECEACWESCTIGGER